MDNYQQYIALSRYARYLPDKKRRELWHETVARYVDFWHSKGLISDDEADELYNAIESLEVMPSMRALMTAGKALERDNVAGFNCSYLPIDHVRAFDELMYILLCGTGVGFSVERQYIQKLPEVATEMYNDTGTIIVPDSKIGWADSFRQLVHSLYEGRIPQWDVSRVRPAGAPLKTFGGRASGPEPLVELFNYAVQLFKGAVGRRLTSLECHDLCCKIADIVVVGGVRRSALISLSNLSDHRMATAKTGQWWIEHPHRALANNSVCYTEKPELSSFLEEWTNLYESRSGERGVFSRPASSKRAAATGRREPCEHFGTNPCSEIILRPNQFCNLSEVVVRAEDDLETLERKVRLATILGTLQATLTDFRYLRKCWQENTEKEALLGVSLTGIMDHPTLSNSDIDSDVREWLEQLREVAIETNEQWAKRLGINCAAAITCVKPSGTVSQLVNSASGIHPRHSEYYIRRVRADMKDPLCQWMAAQGFPWEPDVHNPAVAVFSFPVKAPDGCVTGDDIGAMDQLSLWMIYQQHWCEHKPSITVSYTDEEFVEIGAWLWRHFDDVSGVSFLPKSDHVYAQAPYEAVDERTYLTLCEGMPEINWAEMDLQEETDNVIGAQTLACTATNCEI